MDLGLSGRTALITGASSGLGLGCASALAAEGVEVVLSSRSADKLDAAAATIASGVVATIAADITDRAQLENLCERAIAALGHVDIVIANAGGPPAGNFTSTDVDAYPEALALNLLPTIALCKTLVPPMQSRGWGRVIAITSISAREPMDMLILSNTARAGLTGFLKTTAREVARDGVTVNSLQPGAHLTERFASLGEAGDALAATVPAGVLGDPDDFGRIAAFLCSDAAAYITGVALPVDGGAVRGLQ